MGVGKDEGRIAIKAKKKPPKFFKFAFIDLNCEFEVFLGSTTFFSLFFSPFQKIIG